MADEGDIHVVVEGEDDAGGNSSARLGSDADRRAAAAEGEAARQRLASARMQRQGQLNRIEHELLTVDSESKAAEQAFEAAADMGDFRAQAAANRRMSIAESRRAQLGQRHEDLRQTPVSSGNATEDYLAQFTDPTAAWLRSHPEYISDPRKNSQAQGAHHMALAAGEVPDTPSYFNHVERTLKMRSGGNMRGSSDINPADVTTHITDSGVYLTKGERERANDGSICWNVGNVDGKGQVIRHGDPRVGRAIGNSEYARRKAELVKQGAYSKLG